MLISNYFSVIKYCLCALIHIWFLRDCVNESVIVHNNKQDECCPVKPNKTVRKNMLCEKA